MRDDRVAVFATRPTASLCAYLASRPDRSVNRYVAAEAVWPEAEPEKAAHSLRTALVHVRKALEPWRPLSSEGTELWLRSEGAEIDLLTAEKLYRAGRISQSSGEERETLEQLRTIVARDFLEGAPWEWAEEMRTLWRSRRVEMALRLARIAQAAEDFDLAEAECRRALETDELNEEAWAALFAASAATGKLNEATEKFNFVRQRNLGQEGPDFSSELRSLCKRAVLGQLKGRDEISNSSAAARDLMGKAMDRQLLEDPEAVLPLFASDSFRKEAMKDPPEAWKLLGDVIERTSGTSETRVRVMMLMINLADMVDEYGTAADYAEWLIENLPQDRREYRYAINLLGFMSFELREWDDAWKYLTQFRDLAVETGNPVEIAIATSQIASLHWHQGEFELALSMYRDQLGFLEKDESVLGLHNTATLRANIGILLSAMGRWEDARENLTHAYSAASANNFDYIRSLVMAPLGLARILEGRATEGRRMVSQALSHSFRSRYRRMHQIMADYAAGALAAIGEKSLALSVLDAYSTFRAVSFHARSVSEERFADWVRQMCEGAVQDRPLPADVRVSSVVAMVCDALEAT